MEKILILQLNEVNFDLLKKYIAKLNLKNFDKAINDFGLIETESEKIYENLEPWIQWVSFYTGKSFDEHKVFYLGEKYNHANIFDELEKKKNFKSFLVCPMNLNLNSLNKKSILIPDPWSEHKVRGNALHKIMYKAISKFVQQNSSNKKLIKDYFFLGISILFLTGFKFKINFLKKVFLSLGKKKYQKAILLDLLLFEILNKELIEDNYNIYSLFLNSCAHIQHHYFLSSEFVKSSRTNPSWYLEKNTDPIAEVFKAYDNILGQIFSIKKNLKILIVTGLSQSAINEPEFYYNFKNPELFLNKIGIVNFLLKKRMSRDYTLKFKDKNFAVKAFNVLENIKLNKLPFFKTSLVNNTIYFEIFYNREVIKDDKITLENFKEVSIFDELNFVAIKNSIHNQKGYAITNLQNIPKKLNIKDFYNQILNSF